MARLTPSSNVRYVVRQRASKPIEESFSQVPNEENQVGLGQMTARRLCHNPPEKMLDVDFVPEGNNLELLDRVAAKNLEWTRPRIQFWLTTRQEGRHVQPFVLVIPCRKLIFLSLCRKKRSINKTRKRWVRRHSPLAVPPVVPEQRRKICGPWPFWPPVTAYDAT